MTAMISTKSAEPLKRVGLVSAFPQGLEIPARSPGPEAIACAAGMLRDYSLSGDAGIGTILAKIAALAQTRQDTISFDESVHDWDLMFRAVEERLSSAVSKALFATPGLALQAATAMLQTIVLESVTALSQLHEALTLERGKRHQLDHETANAEGALSGGLARTGPNGAVNGGFVS